MVAVAELSAMADVGNVATYTIATGLLVADLQQFTKTLSEQARVTMGAADYHMRVCHRLVPVHENLLIDELELRDVLRQIADGTLTLEVIVGELDTYIGELMFSAPVGEGKRWLFYVFIDQGEWDYLDCAISPKGKLYFNEFDRGRPIDFYRPSSDEMKHWHL